MHCMITISQKQYINAILQKEGLQNAHPVAVPMDPNLQLQPSEGESADKNPGACSHILVLDSWLQLDIKFSILLLLSNNTVWTFCVDAGELLSHDLCCG